MKKLLFTGLTIIVILSGCTMHDEIIQSPGRKADISRMLEVQKELTAHSLIPIWNIFDQSMTGNEKLALEFLYAYMPLSDLADYQPSFFLDNVKQSLKARQEMPWARLVPEEIFLHFVLPLRVNNENLDSFRLVMYDEIKARIKGMGMADAALEINHWCHEKVNYRGTDSRTSSPLSTISKSFGRCGEETTFTVTAMRTAGIPARQVYTPRWAHVDDNHAWVEVWIDGKWNYLGACEPEPELNLGWFTEPSHRTMLVHTRAYGRYFGNEEVITANDRFSELNLTARYAPVKTFTVSVKDKEGQPVNRAKIMFGLYNYAEFYPIATKYSDSRGITSLAAGLGSLLVWAVNDDLFDFRMISVAETDTLMLTLNKTRVPEHTEFYNLVPPRAVKMNTVIPEEKRMVNNRRLASEDSIRNIHMDTFKDSDWAASLAKRSGLESDSVVRILGKAFGNWPEIAAYLEKNATIYRSTVLALACALSDKDYSDAKEAILTDHLRHTSRPAGMDREIFEKYLLSPRIDLEKLSPWRGFLKNRMGEMAKRVNEDMSVLTGWIRKNITVDDKSNLHSRAPLTPVGVYNLRVADPLSRDIFYVAVCRSMGIPARINPVTRLPEYQAGGKWHQASLDGKSESSPVEGYLQLTQQENPVMPLYYTHFTLARLIDGSFITLGYEEGRKLSAFPSSLALDTGQYMLVTGTRADDGSVLNSLTFFNIGKNERLQVPVSLRTITGEPKPSGRLNPDELVVSIPGQPGPQKLATLAPGKKLVIVLLDPDKEPSRHVLDELGSYKSQFAKWNGRFLLAVPVNKSTRVSVLESSGLPDERILGIDTDNNILAALERIYGQGLADRMPLVILCDQHGSVFLFSAGYKIGIVEQLLKLTR